MTVLAPCPYGHLTEECIAIRRTGPPARCENCKEGRTNEEKWAAQGGGDPKARPWRPLEGPTKEEEVDLKEIILRAIEKHGSISRGDLTTRGPRKEIEEAAVALISEGKIKSWPGARKDSAVYTLPGTPDPMAGKRKAAPAEASGDPRPDPTGSKADPAPVKRGSRAPSAPRGNGRKRIPGPPQSSNEIIAAAIAELEHRRERIDNAIGLLKEEIA